MASAEELHVPKKKTSFTTHIQSDLSGLSWACPSQIHQERRRLASTTLLFVSLFPHPFKLRVISAMLLLLDHQHLAAFLADILGVLPQLILFPLGHPALNQDILGILETMLVRGLV